MKVNLVRQSEAFKLISKRVGVSFDICFALEHQGQRSSRLLKFRIAPGSLDDSHLSCHNASRTIGSLPQTDCMALVLAFRQIH